MEVSYCECGRMADTGNISTLVLAPFTSVAIRQRAYFFVTRPK